LRDANFQSFSVSFGLLHRQPAISIAHMENTYATIKQAILASFAGVRIAKCPERSPLPSEFGKKN
jgi:hypothetical protein